MIFAKSLRAARRSYGNNKKKLAKQPEITPIVVQPVQPIIQMPRPAWWERILPLAGSLISAIVAIAALSVAYNSYRDQHTLDNQSMLTTNAEYADQVSSWLILSSNRQPTELVIQNLGSAPIVDTSAVVTSMSAISDGWEFPLGTVPPCSRVTEEISDNDFSNESGIFVYDIRFTDENGISWSRDYSGKLQETGSDEFISIPNPPGYVAISQPPAGCT
jgi:hypothetical protein